MLQLVTVFTFTILLIFVSFWLQKSFEFEISVHTHC